MKTLEEIINRHDYQRLTKSLSEKVEELAVSLRDKMLELEETSLGRYQIINKRCNGGWVEHVLEDENYESLEDSRFYYVGNDFNCPVTPASNKSKLEFLNEARSLFELLDKIETEKCESIKKALEDNK